MRKEVIFAIIFGTAFGLVIAFGVWRLNSSFSPKPTGAEGDATPMPTESPQGSQGLTISKPNDLTVQTESSVIITGATRANSLVVVSGEEKDSIESASGDGAFGISADLVGGLNQVIVYSEDPDGNSTQKILTIVHSSQFPSNTPEGPTSNASDSVREKVEDKVRLVQNSPIAFIGTITDISKLSLNLKNSNDQIEQVSIDTDATLSNDITKKEVKLGDLAIGDYIIAMGYKNGNQVLSAKRLVVTNKPSTPTRQINIGKVKDIENKILTLAKKDMNIELTFPKSWKGPNIKEVKTDDKVVVVTIPENLPAQAGKNSIRTIQILQ